MTKKDYSVEEKVALIEDFAETLGVVGEIFDCFKREALPYKIFVKMNADKNVKTDIEFRALIDEIVNKASDEENVGVIGGVGGLIRIMQGDLDRKREHLKKIKELYKEYNKTNVVGSFCKEDTKEEKEDAIKNITANIQIYFNKE